MKLSAFMPGYNLISGQYPFIEMIALTLPFVDEFVFNDGGSTDGTLEVIQDIQKLNKKVKLFQYPHLKKESYTGMDEAIDETLKVLSGDWIVEIQADEYYPPVFHDRIRETVKFADKCNYSSIRNPRPSVTYFNYADVTNENYYKPIRIFKNIPGKIYSASGGDCFKFIGTHTVAEGYGSHNLPPEYVTSDFFNVNVIYSFIIDEFIREQRHCNFYDFNHSDGSRYNLFKEKIRNFSLKEFETLDYKNLSQYENLTWKQNLAELKKILIKQSEETILNRNRYSHPILYSLFNYDFYMVRDEIFDYIRDEGKIYEF
jgi:hypothetical protein